MEVATGAMGTLLAKLGELIQEEYNLQMGVKEGIKDLKAELESMQAALIKVSNVPLDQLDPQVQIWASELRELSYAIEDSLDSSMVRIKDLEPTKPSNIIGFIRKTIYRITELKARHKIGNDIKRIESQVRKVKERYDRYKINDIVSNLATTIDPRLSTLYNKVSNLVGTDGAINELTKMLSKGVGMSDKNLKAISVVGFGGLGKTTLAKALYDKIMKKFDCGGFVPVGQNPEIKKILRDILHELDREKYMNITSSQMDVRQLIDELKGFLMNKR
jgi:ATPase subunit of ABC transporter with duplicated ATPase domains